MNFASSVFSFVCACVCSRALCPLLKLDFVGAPNILKNQNIISVYVARQKPRTVEQLRIQLRLDVYL